MHGYVLTNGRNIDYLYQFLRKDEVEILKIVPTWGLPWNDYSRAKILAATKDTIIRTTHGDPSRNIDHVIVRDVAKDGHDYRYLLPQSFYSLDPFLSIKPHCYIELGNEPNLDNVDFWIYRYWLLETIKYLKDKYPYAKLISPAPIVDSVYIEKAKRFYAICQDALMLCDYSGIHAYEHKSFTLPQTNQLKTAMNLSAQYLGMKPLMATELGINDKDISMKDKIKEYKNVEKAYSKSIKAFCIFHINADKDNWPNYSVTLDDV